VAFGNILLRSAWAIVMIYDDWLDLEDW
jgi:hypothetical protein